MDYLINNIDNNYLVDTFNENCLNINNQITFKYKNNLEKGIFKKINRNGQAIINFMGKDILCNFPIIES